MSIAPPTPPRQYGYQYGDPFGNPSQFTRSTQESEVDRYNQWMRSQPFWQQIKGNAPGFDDQHQQQLAAALRAQGITLPSDFHIDEAGNFNQKSRTKRNLMIAGIAGGAALGGLGLAGLGPLGGLGAAATPAEFGISSAPWAGAVAPGVAAAGMGGVTAAGTAGGVIGGATAAANIGANAATHGATMAAPSASSRLASSLLSPEFLGSAAYGTLGYFNSRAQAKTNERIFNAQQRQRMAEDLGDADTSELADNRAREQSYLNSFQEDPVAQAKAMFKAGILRNLAEHGPSHIGPGFQSSIDFSGPAQQFLNDGALEENAAAFYGAAGQMNPYAPARDLHAMGLPGQRQGQIQGQIDDSLRRLTDLNARRRADLLNGINDPGTRSTFAAPNFAQSGGTDYFTRQRVGG